MNRKSWPSLGAFILFISANGFKIAFVTAIMTGLPWSNLPGKLVSTFGITAFVWLLLTVLGRKRWFITFYCVQFVFLFANIAYFYYFHGYLHLFSWFSLASEATSVVTHFAVPLEPELLWLLIDIPFLVLTLTNFSRIVSAVTAVRLRSRNGAGLPVAFFVVAALFVVFLLQFATYWSELSPIQMMTTDKYNGEAVFVYNFGFLGNSVCRLLMNKDTKALANELVYGSRLVSKGIRAEKRIRHIFIFQIESMESGIINYMHNGEFVTPYLHSLTKRAVYFPFCMSYHKGGRTSDAEFSVINSVEPLGDYPAIKLGPPAFVNSFVRLFYKQGYDTLAFHGNDGYFFDRSVAFPEAGFRRFFDMNAMHLEKVYWGAPDDKVFGYVENRLASIKGPTLYYVISMSSHEPYRYVDSYFTETAFDDIAERRTRSYFKSFRYVDIALEKTITDIRNKYPDSLVVIFGDHTGNVQKSGIYRSSVCYGEGNVPFEFVPLFILTPEHRRYVEKKYAVSFLDIAPTILSLSGIPFDIATFGGNILKPDFHHQPIPFNGGLYDRQQLYGAMYEICRDLWSDF